MSSIQDKIRRVNPIVILVILMAVSMAGRIVHVALFVDDDRWYWEDTIHYYSAADSLVTEGTFGFDPERPEKRLPYGLEPVYPLFMAPFALVFGKSFTAIRIVQSLLMVLAALPLYKIIAWLSDDLFALLGSVYYLFYPFYILLAGMLYPESIYVAVLILYVFLTVKYVRQGKTGDLLWSVAVLAVLGHIKMTSWSLLVVSAAAFLMINHRISKEFFLRAILAAFVFLLVSLPWGIRNYQLRGKVSLPRNYASETDESEVGRRLNKSEGPLQNFAMFFSPDVTGAVTENKFKSPMTRLVSLLAVTPLLIAALVLPFLRRGRIIYLLYGTLIAYALPYVLLQARTRYRLPIDFVMIIFFALVLHFAWETLSNKRQRGVEATA